MSKNRAARIEENTGGSVSLHRPPRRGRRCAIGDKVRLAACGVQSITIGFWLGQQIYASVEKTKLDVEQVA